MRQAILVTSLLAALIGMGCQTSPPPKPAAPPPEPEPIPVVEVEFQPAKGVTCNRNEKVCVWRGGPSIGLTRLFFGDAAADKATPAMAKLHFPNDPIFKPNPYASCDTLVTTCYDKGGASDELTARYFGDDALERLTLRRRQIVRYGQHVTCDQTTQICYDRFGAGVGITQLYIAAPEAQALLARLRSRGF